MRTAPCWRGWGWSRWRPVIRQLLILALILVAGAAMLSPVVMALGPEPMPGDFAFTWNNHRFMVPVVYSLCASAGLALLYSILRR